MLSSLALALLAVASADPVPASIRACTSETDVLQRLACFDREVARYPSPITNKAPPAAPAPTATVPAKAAAMAPVTTQAAPTPPPAAPTPAPAKSQPPDAPVRIQSIDRIPNEMIIHLDNGQSWRQLQAAPGDLSLKVGDPVKIEHHLGSDYLTGPHVSNMKVRQQP